MKLKDIDAKRREDLTEYVPAGPVFTLIRILYQRYHGTKTILIFKDMKSNPEVFVYMTCVDMSISQMESAGKEVQEAYGGRLVYMDGINTHNYAKFLVSYDDKYMVSYNYFQDHMLS